MIKKLTAKLMIMCMCISFLIAPSISYAGTELDGVNFVALNEHELLVSDNGNMSLILVEDSGDYTITTIDSLSDSNDGYFIVDKTAHTLYSSYTDTTFSKSEIESAIDIDVKNISPTSSDTRVEYISYKQLSDMLGGTGDARDIAGAIIAILAWMGISLSNPIGIVMGIIGGIIVAVKWGLSHASPNSGLKITLSKIKVTKHQPGGATTIYVYRITGINTY